MGPRLPRRVIVTSLLVVTAVAACGAASAYLRASGSGSGAGTTGTTVALTLTPGTPVGSLYPGGRSDVLLTVTNANPSAIHVGSLALDTGQGTSGFAVDAGHSGCGVAALDFTAQTNAGAGWSVPARVDAVDGTLSVTLATALAMDVGAANACQGAALAVYLAAGP